MAKIDAKKKKIIADLKKSKGGKTTKTKKASTTKATKKTTVKKKPEGKNAVRRKKTVENVVQQVKSGKKPNVKKAAIDAGYSPDYANGNLQGNKTFWDALNAECPDHLLAQRLGKLGESMRGVCEMVSSDLPNEVIESWVQNMGGVLHKIVEGKTMKTVTYYMPDTNGISKGIDMMLKVKGLYAPKKFEDVTDPIGALTDDELEEEISRRESELILD